MSLADAAPSETMLSQTPELIAHILEHYHAAHRRDLAEAIRLATRVEQLHALREDCPHGLTDLLTLISDDLEEHQQKEEVVLFPLMLATAPPPLIGPMRRMQMDHDDLGRQLKDLRALTRDYAAPVEACATWRRLYELCGRLDSELKAHVALENDVLFPRFGGMAIV